MDRVNLSQGRRWVHIISYMIRAVRGERNSFSGQNKIGKLHTDSSISTYCAQLAERSVSGFIAQQ